ncbi:MAG: D-tyrosyl-tRNA(Tyr) deacylase [Planctomycetes bacterium RBG_16_64_10]|nr:MAG: D-tyrosyl-tRNA(Tyr) deacylase [Planctomycetes bacterium RBG_16_64_10]
MRACLQRVTEAQVSVGEAVIGRIGQGLVVLLGVAQGDTEQDAVSLAAKTLELRIFADEHGRMNRSVIDVGGALLVISQFTLLGDCRKGRRPSFVAAADPELAERLYEVYVTAARSRGVETATGRFRAAMCVALQGDGPVTLLLDSRRAF